MIEKMTQNWAVNLTKETLAGAKVLKEFASRQKNLFKDRKRVEKILTQVDMMGKL